MAPSLLYQLLASTSGPLRPLIISSGYVEDADFACLRSHTQLGYLGLNGLERVTNAVFDDIARIPHLHAFSIVLCDHMHLACIEQCIQLKLLFSTREKAISYADMQRIASIILRLNLLEAQQSRGPFYTAITRTAMHSGNPNAQQLSQCY